MKLVPRVAEIFKRSGYTREYIVLKIEEYEGKGKGVNLKTLSNWCTGRSKPNVERLFILSKICRCKTDDFYEWVEDENDSTDTTAKA